MWGQSVHVGSIGPLKAAQYRVWTPSMSEGVQRRSADLVPPSDPGPA